MRKKYKLLIIDIIGVLIGDVLIKISIKKKENNFTLFYSTLIIQIYIYISELIWKTQNS